MVKLPLEAVIKLTDGNEFILESPDFGNLGQIPLTEMNNVTVLDCDGNKIKRHAIDILLTRLQQNPLKSEKIAVMFINITITSYSKEKQIFSYSCIIQLLN